MSGVGVFSLLAGLFQLTVPSYALRLIRRFGATRVGWFVVAAFASLALLHFMEPVHAPGAAPRLDWVYVVGSALLLIGMGHLETIFSERFEAGSTERKLRARLEREFEAQAKALLKRLEDEEYHRYRRFR